MRSRHAVLVFASLMFVAAAPAANAISDDACQLLTQQQVSAAVGVAVGAGSHVTPTYLKTCTWTASGSGEDVRDVTISFQSAPAFQGTKAMTESMVAGAKAEKKGTTASVEPASGIGDDAFYATMGEGYTGLLVKKGNVSFKVAIYGAMPTAKKKEAEKTLAQEALSKI